MGSTSRSPSIVRKRKPAGRLRRKPIRLTEDEADLLFHDRHKNEKRYPLSEVLGNTGHAVDR